MIKLNLGCGYQYLEGYINVDLYAEKVDERDDIEILERVTTIMDESKFDEIYSAHSLMCVPEGKLLSTLTLWKGLLKEGGKLIIETTDLDKQIKKYNQDIKHSEVVIRSLFGNDIMDGKGLRYQFNFYLLELWLKRAGFKNITKIEQPEYSVHNSKFNLIVEAIK